MYSDYCVTVTTSLCSRFLTGVHVDLQLIRSHGFHYKHALFRSIQVFKRNSPLVANFSLLLRQLIDLKCLLPMQSPDSAWWLHLSNFSNAKILLVLFYRPCFGWLHLSVIYDEVYQTANWLAVIHFVDSHFLLSWSFWILRLYFSIILTQFPNIICNF